jgi:hypothetical protein
MMLRLVSFVVLGMVGLAPLAAAQAPAPAANAPAAGQPAPAAGQPTRARDSCPVALAPLGARPSSPALRNEAVASGSKAPGLKGLGAGEVTLRGTMASRGGYVAILQGADSKTYIVRPGERLADGTIRSITADALVILQQVNDPLSLEKQREVRKVLRQTEEGRQ